MADANVQITLLIILAAVALSMLIQAFAVLAAFFVARKTINKLQGELNETRAKVMGLMDKAEPIIENTREFLVRATPKIEAAIADVTEVTQKMRAESKDVQVAANELIERARRQGARVDTMMTKTFDTVERAAGFMTHAVAKPMRQLSAVMASAKAVVETLRNGQTDGHVRPGIHVRPEVRPHVERIKTEQDFYA